MVEGWNCKRSECVRVWGGDIVRVKSSEVSVSDTFVLEQEKEKEHLRRRNPKQRRDTSSGEEEG